MIRKLESADKTNLIELINKINLFSEEEKEVAAELIFEAIEKPGQKYYNIFVFEESGKILGYHCTGKRALTDGVFDLYWIVVDPNYQGRGIGKKLLAHAEDFAKANGGRMILVETSSKDDYVNTRMFYLRNKYEELVQINDFYSEGNNLIIFNKIIKI